MTDTTKTGKYLVTLVVANVILVLAVILVYWEIRQNIKLLSELRGKIGLELDKAEKIKSVTSLVSSTADKRAKIDSVFVGKEGVVDFIEFIESLGRSSGVVTEVKFVGLAETPGLQTEGVENFKMTLEAVGPWKGAIKFLTLVDTAPKAIFINKVSVRKSSVVPAESKKWIPNWVVSMDLSVKKFK